MEDLSKTGLINLAKKHNVKFIRLQFTDILGMIKNISIPIGQLETVLDGKIMFDGSSIEGFSRIQESDMYLKPDYNTFTILPWRPLDGAVARLICDVYTPDGEPFAGCPRGVLKRVIKEAEEMGYTLYAGPEPEFFLFETDDKGRPMLKTHDQGCYFDLTPVDKGEDARRDIILALEEMGFEVEASHHEVAPGQHEIDFKYTDALLTADNIATFRMVAKAIASKHGLYATFMPKPIFGINGSGMHTHMSLFKNGVNVFAKDPDKIGLSDTGLHFIGGLLAHATGMAAITNPLVNSYKRLVPGYEAPVYISWSSSNRSALVRVPAAKGNGSRVELRNPDPAVNPYLALAVMFKAGLEGVKKQIDPGPECFRNIYEMTPEEKEEAGIKSLPSNLLDAINLLGEDDLIRGTLGEHIYGRFVHAKKMEWDNYRVQVHDWETQNYLGLY